MNLKESGKNMPINNDQTVAVAKSPESSSPASVETHTKRIGIIYPPPEIRRIVDTTAQFVAANVLGFEKRIVVNSGWNSKFNFLRADDPYHDYYQHRLSEARPENQASARQQRPPPPLHGADAQSIVVPKVLEAPEAEQFTVRIPEGVITGEEMDVIKLTALFVARNGKSFLNGLVGMEGSNPLFFFLRPTHSMFMYFTSLVDAYSKILMPPEGLIDRLRNSVADMGTVLERCLLRVEWEKLQEQAKQKAENEIEKERIIMAEIDWHDFVVVEEIDFADDEDEQLPPPMTLEELKRRSKISDVDQEDVIEEVVDMELDEEEAQLVEEGMRAGGVNFEENGGVKNIEAKASVQVQKTLMRIVKNWKRPEERISAEKDQRKYVACPITGELVLIDEMTEHIRISLIDPKYQEQKNRMFSKIRETTLAADDEIARNIVGLARNRPDIFGTTDEEVSNAIKAEIAMSVPKQLVWDGHTDGQAMFSNGDWNLNLIKDIKGQYMMANYPSMSAKLSNIPAPPPHGSQDITLSGPRPSFCVPMLQHGTDMVSQLPPLPQEDPRSLRDEKERKRQRLDGPISFPEGHFLDQHKGPARICICLPNVEETKLKSQLLDITVQSLSETIGSLKEKISGKVLVPANKLKLAANGDFPKDHFSLAYYNISFGDSLSLSLRGRGRER